MFKDLDPLLHSQPRLSIMSILLSLESVKFSWLLEQTKASKGNLSIQLNRLKDAGYVSIKKEKK